MIARHEYTDAATLATAQTAGLLHAGSSGSAPPSVPASTPTSPNGQIISGHAPPGPPPKGGHAGEPSQAMLVAEARARAFNNEGEPALAACCYLAQGEASAAVNELLRTHQYASTPPQ